MKYNNKRIARCLLASGVLIGMLLMSSAIRAEALPEDTAAASGVAVASEVAAAAPVVPEVTTAPDASSPLAETAPVVPEVATAPGAIPPLEERLQLCAGCHNPDGNSIIPENPKLSGLNAKYLNRQLKDFKSGDRASPIMSSIIPMVDESEFKALAGYFSEQKRTAGESEKPDLAVLGKQIYDEGIIGSAVPACSGCHNEDGSGTDKYPRLTGQHSLYVSSQLTNFKSGERKNDPKAVMQTVAKRMSEAEIQAVSEYIVTLKEAE